MKKYIKYYVFQLLMVGIMLVFAFAFAQFSRGRGNSGEMIALYLVLTVLYFFCYFFLRHQLKKGGKSAQDILHLLQTEEIYSMLHVFNQKVGLVFTLIMGLGSILVYFLKH